MARHFDIACKYDLDLAQMALQFVTTRPFVTSNIIGATTLAQLETNIESANIDLSEDVFRDIDDTHLVYSNPCS